MYYNYLQHSIQMLIIMLCLCITLLNENYSRVKNCSMILLCKNLILLHCIETMTDNLYHALVYFTIVTDQVVADYYFIALHHFKSSSFSYKCLRTYQ